MYGSRGRGNLITMNSEFEDLTLEEVFNKFIAEKKAINLAEETIATYESVFNNFKKVYSSEKSCNGITPDIIKEFIKYFQKRNPNIKIVSINTQLRHLRAILYYTMDMSYLQKFSIKMMNYQKEEKDIYSEAEQKRLTAIPHKKCNFAEFRNWAMVCYFLGTGNRLNTVRNLKIGDIDFENDEVVLKKLKNNKSYRIPLSPLLVEILQEYLKHRKGQLEDYLFPNQYGGPMTRNTITILLEAGYITRKKYLYGVPYLYTLTYKGRIFIGENKRLETIRIDRIAHDISMIEVAIFYIKKYGLTLNEVISEKELHSKSGFGTRKHTPDLVVNVQGGTYAIEIELNPKEKARMQKNINNNFVNYSHQIWFTNNNKVKSLIEEFQKQYPNLNIVNLEGVRAIVADYYK